MGRLRTSVTRYDPNGDLAEVVWDLGSLALAPNPRVAMEARYLRAMVATDVLVYLDAHPAPWLRERIGRAMDVAPDRLEAAVRGELASLEAPFVAQAVTLEHTLDALSSTALPRPAADDTRAAILLVSRLGRLSGSEAREALATIGRDPCRGAPRCPAPYADLAPADRRVVEGLAVAARAIRSLESQTETDPLATLASPALGGAMTAIRALQISTDPLAGWATLDAEPTDLVDAPAVLIAVGEGSARVARRAAFAIDADGFVRAVAGGVPSFPRSADVAVGRSRDVRTLAALLAGEVSATDGSVGLFVDPHASSVALGRVIGALSQAGARRISLALSRPDGGVSFVATRFAEPGRFPASARGAGQLRVLVTAIGYWVFEGQRDPVQVPLAASSGTHDAEGLRHQLGERRRVTAAVACRGEIGARPVLLAALALRRSGTDVPTVVVTY